jgi:hypothetical protein
MTSIRVLLVALLYVFAPSANLAVIVAAQAQPAAAMTLVGPGGRTGAGVERALVAAWRARGHGVRYAAVVAPQPVARLLAALRDSAPADLVLFDPLAADAALAKGLIVPVPEAAVPRLDALHPLARSGVGPCVPIAFDRVAVIVPAALAQTWSLLLPALGDQAWLEPPGGGDLLGMWLVAQLAQSEAGNWRDMAAGLRRLRAPPSPGAASVHGAIMQWASDPPPDGMTRVAVHDGAVLRPLLLCLSATAPHLRDALAMINTALQSGVQAALARELAMAPARGDVALLPALRAQGLPLDGAVLPDTAGLVRLRAALTTSPTQVAGDRRTVDPAALPSP